MRDIDASEILSRQYGIDGQVLPLAGERDLNFRVDTGNQIYVLKIQSADELDAIEAQNVVISHLVSTNKFTWQQLVPTLSGETHCVVSDTHIARLLTWIDGDLWITGTSNSDLLRDLGRAVATLDTALKQVEIPQVQPALQRPFGWNVLQTQELLKQIDHVQPHLRPFAESALREVIALLPNLLDLPQQVIHNDGNDNNVIVREDKVIGLIDFGDIIIAPRICGLAVTCAYAMWDFEDPILSVLDVLRGYHEVTPLSPEELELLFPLILGRIATSVVMAAVQSKAAPDNDYLLVSQGTFAVLLKKLSHTSAELSHFRFRNACGYEASPTSRQVRQYLMSGRAKIGDVVFPPLSRAKRIRFDWSTHSENTPTTSSEIQKAMESLGVDIAIGNYCEDRDVYKGDAYAVANEQRRTVHLGVDLFAPAGTPVYAALDGVVELFNDNFAPLDYGPVIILRHQTDDGIPFYTLYGHLSRPSLETLFIGKEIRAGEQIATMGEEFENVGWAPHTHFQLLTSLCGMGVDIYGVAPLNELPMWRSISPDPNLCLRFEEGTDVHAHLPEKQLLDERSTKLSRALSLNFKRPLEIVRGQGAYLFDNYGNPYLDLVNNVAHVGHSHARVVAAGQNQMAILNTNTRYINQLAIEYARSLANTLPDPLSVVFLVNSGSEANDLALRLARAHTKAQGMLVLDHAYHGHLSSIIDISPYKFNGKGGQGCPDYVRVVPTPDSYKGIHQGPGSGALYAQEFENQLADLPVPLCAFISESIVSTAGQIVLADGFLKTAFEIVRRAGGVCIADEVQIGLGRIGQYFWGFELHGVVPDIVTMGKPLGNGHPLAAVVTTPEIAHSFLNGMEYFNTFGGNPVSAAIGQSVLDVIADQYLQANAHNMGTTIMNNVRNLAKTNEVIGDVRGSGLFIGIEFVTDAATQTPATTFTSNLIEFAKKRGVFLSSDGPANNVLKIKPPLVIGQQEVDLFLSVLADGLTSLPLE